MVRQVDIKAIMCSPEELAELFVFQPLTNASKISGSLCQLKDVEVAHIVDYIVKNVTVGEFIKGVGCDHCQQSRIYSCC